MENEKFKKLFGGLDGEMLKKIPEGFPKDLPDKVADILKHKNFVVYCDKPDSFFNTNDWLDRATEDFNILYPFNQFLNYTIGEFYGKI
jgi:adenylate kinase